MNTLQDLIDCGFPLDAPIIVVDPQRDESGATHTGAFQVEIEYDLTVHDDEGTEYILLRVREDLADVLIARAD